MTRVIIYLCFVISLFLETLAFAGDCKKIGSVCIDSTPCKMVNGVQVCLSQFGLSCWEYEDTYQCLKPNSVNYCQPLINAQPQCWQTNSQCIQMDTMFNTGCMKYSQTWRCGNPSMPTPPNTIKLNDTYTLVSSSYNTSQCQSLSGNPNCSLAESKCVQTTPDSPLPPGISSSQVAPDGCYKKQEIYTCLTGKTDSSECDGYASDPNCTYQSSTCDSEDMINGKCIFETKTYKCMSQPPKTNTFMDCSGQMFCMDGNCFDTGYEKDTDFAQAMALMETAREAGTYLDPNSMEIFKGAESKCRIKLFGLANCCKKSGGGEKYNNNLLFDVAVQVGSQALSYGSRYVYDALMDNSNFLKQGIGSLLGIDPTKGALANWSPSISLYGFSVSTGAVAPGFISSTLGFGVIPLGNFGGLYFSFDPTMFAIQIGLMVLQELMSCEQPEQLLALRRGQNLCVNIGTYCSKKVAKVCFEKKKSYCCYNSRLARIINEQGRAQIGKSWGSPKNPDCSGFTPQEFEKIDFSQIDLSEFISEIMANIKMPDLSGIQQNIHGVVEQKIQNYYQKGSQ